MLYSKNWQGCPKGFHSLIGLFPLLAVILMTSCLGGEHHKNRDITMAAFSDLKTPAFVLDAASIKRQLCEIASKDTPQTAADRAVRDYYSENSEHLLWIDRLGVDSRPDTLLSWLHQVGQMGLSERAFYVAPIEALLQRLRQMDFQPSSDINRVAAQLEYHLSKACLHIVHGGLEEEGDVVLVDIVDTGLDGGIVDFVNLLHRLGLVLAQGGGFHAEHLGLLAEIGDAGVVHGHQLLDVGFALLIGSSCLNHGIHDFLTSLVDTLAETGAVFDNLTPRLIAVSVGFLFVKFLVQRHVADAGDTVIRGFTILVLCICSQAHA